MTGGGLRFARFAWPPNHLGHCGPAADQDLWRYATGAPVDAGLGELARGFDGAWPYLELLAGLAGLEDPLDARVVDAYWLGGDLLDRVDLEEWWRPLEDAFAGRLGGEWERLLGGAAAGGRPTHSFHVLCVYPWLGLLRCGVIEAPLRTLDQCRVRPASVVAVADSTATVRVRPLAWEGDRLVLASPTEVVVDTGPAVGLAPGEIVALHWNRVCDRLDRRQADALAADTAHHLAVANQLGTVG